MGKKYKGFSLIEILVVVALIVILATITIVAINPAKNFRDTRNAQRSADIMQILNAVTQYTSEQNHSISNLTFGGVAISTDCDDPTNIVTGATPLSAFEDLLVDEYIVSIPRDPLQPAGGDTGYQICITGTSGRVQVMAPLAATDGKTAPLVVKR